MLSHETCERFARGDAWGSAGSSACGRRWGEGREGESLMGDDALVPVQASFDTEVGLFWLLGSGTLHSTVALTFHRYRPLLALVQASFGASRGLFWR